MNWADYDKKDKLLQKTKPRNQREYLQQLKKSDMIQAKIKEQQDKRKRAGVRSFRVTYIFLSQADCSTLLLAIKPASFTVICPDPETGVNGSFKMYSSDKDIDTLDFGKVSSGVPRWKNISFTLVEY